MKISAKKIPSALFTAAILLAIVLFFLFPARYAQSVKDGVTLWAVSVLPATLPMLFLTAIFTKRKLFQRASSAMAPVAGKLFRISGAGALAALLSIISGYPVGAKTVCDLKKANVIGEEELFRISALATTTGPAFLVGAVGSGMFQSAAAGWVMYLSHLTGVFAVCFFLRFGAKPQKSTATFWSEEGISLSEVLQGSVLSVLCVGGAIAVFYAFGQMIADIGATFHTAPLAEAFLRGLLEMTAGCAFLAQAPSPLALALATFFVTFGGICVLLQQLAFLSQVHVSTKRFLTVKILQGTVSALVCFLFALLFKF